MAYYKCKHCNMKVNSKCVHQRSIFPADDPGGDADVAGLLSNFLKCTVEDQVLPDDHWNKEMAGKVYRRDVSIIYQAYCNEEIAAMSEPELLMMVLDQLARHMQHHPGAMKMWACDHKYIPLETCDFGCCKPRKRKKAS